MDVSSHMCATKDSFYSYALLLVLTLLGISPLDIVVPDGKVQGHKRGISEVSASSTAGTVRYAKGRVLEVIMTSRPLVRGEQVPIQTPVTGESESTLPSQTPPIGTVKVGNAYVTPAQRKMIMAIGLLYRRDLNLPGATVTTHFCPFTGVHPEVKARMLYLEALQNRGFKLTVSSISVMLMI